MKLRWIPWLAMFLGQWVIPSKAEAQECVIRGRGLTVGMTVQTQSMSFDVSMASDVSEVALSHAEPHQARARGYLELEGELTGDPLLVLQHVVQIAGVLTVGRDRAFQISSPRMDSRGLTVSLTHWGGHFDHVAFPCSALMLTSRAQMGAYRQGLTDSELTSCHGLCLPATEQRACDLARAEGFAAMARMLSVRAPNYVDLPIRVPRNRRLHVAAAPGASPLTVNVRQPRFFALRVLNHRRGWTHILYRWGTESKLDGWVPDNELRVPSGGGGSLGSSPIGFGQPGTRILTDTISAIINPGTPVFVSRNAEQPWAIVRGTVSVLVPAHPRVLPDHLDRIQILSVPGLDMRRPGAMWVARDQVDTGVSSVRGLTIRLSGVHHQRRISVIGVDAHSTAYRSGLRESDIIVSIAGHPVDGNISSIRQQLSESATFSVRRENAVLRLENVCLQHGAHECCQM